MPFTSQTKLWILAKVTFHHFLVQIFVTVTKDLNSWCPRERARLDRILKMKTVRMTALMAFCFTICQVAKVLPYMEGGDNHVMMKVPMAVLYLVAWQDPAKPSEHLNPIVVEVCQAVR